MPSSTCTRAVGAKRFRGALFENVFMARLLLHFSSPAPLDAGAPLKPAEADDGSLLIVDPTMHGMTCPLVRPRNFGQESQQMRRDKTCSCVSVRNQHFLVGFDTSALSAFITAKQLSNPTIENTRTPHAAPMLHAEGHSSERGGRNAW